MEISVQYFGNEHDPAVEEMLFEAFERAGFKKTNSVIIPGGEGSVESTFTRKDLGKLTGNKVRCISCFEDIDRARVDKEGYCIKCQAVPLSELDNDSSPDLPAKTSEEFAEEHQIAKSDEVIKALSDLPTGKVITILHAVDGENFKEVKEAYYRKIGDRMLTEDPDLDSKLAESIKRGEINSKKPDPENKKEENKKDDKLSKPLEDKKGDVEY